MPAVCYRYTLPVRRKVRQQQRRRTELNADNCVDNDSRAAGQPFTHGGRKKLGFGNHLRRHGWQGMSALSLGKNTHTIPPAASASSSAIMCMRHPPAEGRTADGGRRTEGGFGEAVGRRAAAYADVPYVCVSVCVYVSGALNNKSLDFFRIQLKRRPRTKTVHIPTWCGHTHTQKTRSVFVCLQLLTRNSGDNSRTERRRRTDGRTNPRHPSTKTL